MWAVLQKWVLALPVTTPEQRSRRLSLQKELQWVVEVLDDGKGIGEDGVCGSTLWMRDRDWFQVDIRLIFGVYSWSSRTAISSAPTSSFFPAKITRPFPKMVLRRLTSSIMNTLFLHLLHLISLTTLLSGVVMIVTTT